MENERASPNRHDADYSDGDDERRSVWEVRIGVYTTRQQADEVKERFTRLLCPDPEFYAELTEQGRPSGSSGHDRDFEPGDY